MVEVRIEGDTVVFDVQGSSQLWALRREIVVPAAAIRRAERAPGAVRGWMKGWRIPGTHVPNIIVAGTYFQRDRSREFWDVRRGERAIAVELEGARYRRIVVDVPDPDRTVAALNELAGR